MAFDPLEIRENPVDSNDRTVLYDTLVRYHYVDENDRECRCFAYEYGDNANYNYWLYEDTTDNIYKIFTDNPNDASGREAFAFCRFNAANSKWMYYTNLRSTTATHLGYNVFTYASPSPRPISNIPKYANIDEAIGAATPPVDPYAPAGGNDGGGGTGNFDDTSDTIPVPSLPSVSITDSGFLTLFATNQAGLRSLANYLWSDLFSAISPQGSMEETITTLKKVVANPYDAILGCSLVPVTVPTGASKDVKLYGVLDSGVTLPVASSQYVAVDCGTLNINEYWGAYLDYAPYTKVTSLYLPYVGVVSIDTDLIMGKSLQVIYHVDILSGQCVAYIVINGSVEFQYMGHCATPIPVTSIDYSSTIQAGLGLVGSIANIAGSAVGGALGGGGAVGALTGGAKSLMGEAGSVAQNVMNSKPDIKSGSGIGGMGGMMSVQKPFLIIERPRQSLPKKDDLSQNHWTGYPSNMARKLGDLSGYTEVARIFINRTTATAEEKEEIARLLTEGVYI